MRPIFQGFCINQFGIFPLHYIPSHSDFGFEYAEIFVIEKCWVGEHQLSDSASGGVADSPTWRVRYWMFKRKLLGESAIECLKENSLHRWVGYFPTCRVRELISVDLYVCLLLQGSLVQRCLKCDYKLPATKVPEPVYVKLKLQIYNHGLITCIER